MNPPLPKSLVAYIREMGVRALDHVAEGEGEKPAVLQALIDQWRGMSDDEKNSFIDAMTTAITEVVAASMVLPIGLKIGKKAVKSARKVIKKQKKVVRKAAKLVKPKKKGKKKAKAA